MKWRQKSLTETHLSIRGKKIDLGISITHFLSSSNQDMKTQQISKYKIDSYY